MAVLALDISGTPRQWITNDTAISYHATKSVGWSMGEIVARYRGGLQNDGTSSYLETSCIIAIKGHGFNPHKHAQVALSNKTLFGRDRNLCAYCGKYFANFHALSRDHIIPKSKGGETTKDNLITSCFECNQGKHDFLLSEQELKIFTKMEEKLNETKV